ncbi:ATP synthase subunit I [Psychrobacter sp. I-STPA10]|uniref:ATP synthase subunit I n=1 Tax=Psychrobacter sp. I-STPA10 TaxID=2585769 RepID=UPI001E569D44|nr:ATP synthase subunit I [Psychrobacter sp. I-STPA10]
MGFIKKSQSVQSPVRQRAQDRARHTFKQLLSYISWLILSIIIIAWLLDAFYWHSNYIVTKSISLGAGLNGATHLVFAWAVFRHTGSRARRHIVNNLYLGQMLKWAVTLAGFVGAFILVKPLSTIGMFCGFIIMQCCYVWILWRIDK